MNTETQNNCSFLRRLGSILYDSILLTAVFFFGTFILIASIGEGEIESGNYFYNLFLIIMAYFYFCWHWVNGRQTLGMNCWHVTIVTESDTHINWKQASLRYIASILSLLLLGLGFIWAIFDKEKLALHDRLSKTKLIVNKKT